jgi:cytochrome P450
MTFLTLSSDPEFMKFLAGKGQTGGVSQNIQELFGKNVFSESDEEEWKRHRSVLNLAFTPDSMKRVLEVSASEMRDRLFPIIDKHTERDSFEDVSLVALDIIGRAGFYHDFDTFQTKESKTFNFYKVVDEWSRIFPTYQMTPEWLRKRRFGDLGRLWEISDIFKQTIGGIIKEREHELKQEQDRPENDLLTLIMTSSQKEGLSEDEMIANGITFFFAGHETTAKTLGFALYLLAVHQDKQQAMQESLQNISYDLTWEDYEQGKLMYAEAVMKETLRLFPVVIGITRENHATFEWEGYKIPERTFIAPTWSASHISAEYWRDPLDFTPERFIPGHEREEIPKPFSYSPFGCGPRACVGRRFAEVEGIVVLTMLLKRYNVRLRDKGYKLEEVMVFALKPKENPILVFERR